MIQLTFEHRTSGTVVSTIDFQTDGRVLGYIPTTSEKETVTESCELLIEEDSSADLQSKIRAIETMIELAKKHPTGPEGIWVLYSPNTSTPWQSRLVNGAILFDEKTGFLWEKFQAKLELIFERLNYWEEKTATVLKLSNGAVTDANSAPISNAQNSTQELYVWIASTQVGGVLPTPAILEFENTQDDATLVDDLLVGVLHGDGSSTPPTPGTLVAEGAGSADASCSGGSYAAESWSDAAENQLDSWTIDSGNFLQKRYRVVARLRDSVAYTDLFLKAKILAGSIVIAETRWSLVEASKSLVMIGTMKIPPYVLGQVVDIGNVTLALYEKRASGAGIMNLDYLLMMPQDSWRRYEAISGLAYGETLVDDPVKGVLITDDGAGAYSVTQKVMEGEPLMLRPGVKNYLYFLQQDTNGDAPIARTASVVVKAHARRLTI